MSCPGSGDIMGTLQGEPEHSDCVPRLSARHPRSIRRRKRRPADGRGRRDGLARQPRAGGVRGWNDDRIDALLHDLADAFADAAEELAIATVAETGMGSVLDKTFKNQFASLGVCASFAGKPGQGTLTVDAARQVAEVASPVGVVFGVVPVTQSESPPRCSQDVGSR